MARTQKYFIGPQLLGDIRRVVGRVEAQPYGSAAAGVETRLQEMQRPGSGGGLLLGVPLDGAWLKDTLADVSVYDDGDALTEEPSSPARVIQGCVNKMVSVPAGSFVIIGKISGRWYLVSAECG
jgi:hypothetical protein